MLKNFRFNVVWRVLAVTAAGLFFAYALTRESWWMARILAGLLGLGLTIELIRYVERTNRNLHNFLLAIRHRDYTFTFPNDTRGPSFERLRDVYNEIFRAFQHLRAEKESHYLYLQNVVEHVQVALICYTADGQIQLMNGAAKKLLEKPYLSKIDALGRVDPELLVTIQTLEDGERKLVKANINGEVLNLAVTISRFRIQEEGFSLVSLQNIRSELDEKEIDTWQKMIRVLTHEIMNSVTPIISLSKVLKELVQQGVDEQGNLGHLPGTEVEDILSGMDTIETRSKGLLHFVHAYRSLTKIQEPNFQTIDPAEVIDRVVALLRPEAERREINLELDLPAKPLKLQADPELLEQVLINLVKNAIEALKDRQDAHILLRAFAGLDGRVHLQVEDNGPGIDPEYADRIFIPFFTTKSKGSGIGLSLSRQIARLHKANLDYATDSQTGTTFTLSF